MDLRDDPRVAAAKVSRREAEVLAAVGRRLTNPEIAAELFISVRTVESHIAALLRKLRAPDRRTLVELALDAAGRATVPQPSTSFVGRARELREVAQLLPKHPLVTLLGAPGCGKTRLAQEVASRWTGEVRLVDLSALAPLEVESALVDALDLGSGSGPSLAGRAQIALASRSVLLVMDNCENVADAAASVASPLLEAARGLRGLATSRRPLGLPSEVIRTVPPLALPTGPDPHAVMESPAGRLFVERSASVRADFELDDRNAEVVATVCERVDGLPLAIELAAASLRSMNIQELASALERRGVLPEQTGRAPRHRTVNAAIEWSWSRLDPGDAALLTRLAALPAGLESEELGLLEALRRPPVTDVMWSLARLVDQSLIAAHVVPGEPTRYELLETIRAFALARAPEGEVTAVRSSFARVQRDLLAATAPDARESSSRRHRDEQDRRKLVAALWWSAEQNPDVAQDLVVSIAVRYELDPSRSMLEAVREVVDRYAIPDGWPAHVLAWAGVFLNYLDLDLLKRCAQLAASRAADEEDAAFAAWSLGFAHAYAGEPERAATSLMAAATHFSAVGNEWMVAHCNMARGLAETDPADAMGALDRSVLMFLELGASWHANSARLALVRRALESRINMEDSARWLEASLEFSRKRGLRLDHAHAELAEAQLAAIDERRGDARSFSAQSANVFRRAGDLRCLGRALLVMAAHDPAPTEAVRLSGDALEVALLHNDRLAQASALRSLAEAATAANDLALAARAIGAAGKVTGKPPSAEGVIDDDYGSFVLEGQAGGPSFVLSQI